VAERIRDVCAALDEVRDGLRRLCDGQMARLRTAHNLFCCAIVERSRLHGDLLADLSGRAAALRYTVSVQGRKLYLHSPPADQGRGCRGDRAAAGLRPGRGGR
jgi:hypothetical protein